MIMGPYPSDGAHGAHIGSDVYGSISNVKWQKLLFPAQPLNPRIASVMRSPAITEMEWWPYLHGWRNMKNIKIRNQIVSSSIYYFDDDDYY
jgi:hypothetical protein